MKSYQYLLIIVLSAFVIILVVFHFGDIPNRHNNGFVRNYFPSAISKVQEAGFQDVLYDIVGSTARCIYVTTATPGEILEVSRNQHDGTKRIKIPFFARFYDSLQLGSLAVKIDSPYVYLFAENKPAIAKTTFDSTLFEVRILPPGPFTREAMVSNDCFILRKIEPRLTDQVFVRYDLNTGLLKKEDGISQIYGDGGVVSDGQLHFDAATGKLYYIYFYKNSILSFDTSLHFLARYSSIDTTSSFHISTAIVNNSGTAAYTNVTPANMINRVNDVHNGLLFNMSTLKADNETDDFFSDHSILDIIDLKNGRYLGSIYFPAPNGSKPSKIMIAENKLIALYTHSLIIYDLHLHPDRQDQ
ncbi:hypothetical protein Q4E93_09580 [Flavitalea sp. BT771]|uniref:hypothetical protein n=1 Tax=Flavitalea sp. BT771 TaxID=3063329 RepID=UPI0026E3113F|nr:hypothetical protein [Flavitalea sp. BT771]MDO6430840.1 hypothetical protein [Flavitalea sp. BT771]MDV6219020.1 hypothetical protein [Flavitalea sp. BT771]